MRREKIIEELAKHPVLRVESGPQGIDINGQVRLRSGSGIAGRSGIWSLRYIKGGTVVATNIRTITALRKAIREWISRYSRRADGQGAVNWFEAVRK